MKKNVIILTGCLFLFFMLEGCDKINFLNPKKITKKTEATIPVRAVKGTIIAKVNNMPVTLEDLNQEIDSYNSIVPAERPEAKITTREQKINYLKNQLVRNMLLYQEGLNRGLDRKEEVLNDLEKTKMNLVIVELVKQESEKVDVSSKEIEDYYNTYKDQLKEPEERQVREIVVPTEQEAKDILVQLLQGADFATLAKEKSKSASSTNGGDLGFIPRGKKFAQFDAAAFSDTLEPGSVSNIFKGPDGYYIIKLEAKRGGKQKSLSELWDDIKRALLFIKQEQKIEDLVGKLSREGKLEIYESEIK